MPLPTTAQQDNMLSRIVMEVTERHTSIHSNKCMADVKFPQQIQHNYVISFSVYDGVILPVGAIKKQPLQWCKRGASEMLPR